MPYINTQISYVVFESSIPQKKIAFYSDFPEDLVIDSAPSWIESSSVEYTSSGEIIKGYIILNAYADATGETMLGEVVVSSSSDVTGYSLTIPAIYPFDTQHIKLTEAVNVAVQLAGDNSYISRRDKGTALLAAKRWLQDTPHACNGNLRMAELPIEDGKVYVPPDFMSFVSAYRVTSDGWLVPIYQNDGYNTSNGYLQDDNRMTITDSMGYVIGTEGLTPRPDNTSPYTYLGDTWEDKEDSGVYYIKGGIINFNGFIKYDEVNSYFVVDGIGDDAIVIEYISDPIVRASKKLDEYGLRVHKNFQEPLEKYIYWRLIEMNRSVPLSTKLSARKEYSLAMRRARPSNVNSIVQALRGRNKGNKL